MPPAESFLIVANPASGRGRRHIAEEVAQLLQARDCIARLCWTSAKGDAGRLASAACLAVEDRPDCVVACGGDGTVQEVAHALAAARAAGNDHVPSMGLAPAGRCNDFATVLGMTRRPEQIASVLLEGEASPLDLGMVNGRYFCTVATAGLDAEVTAYVDAMRGPLHGTLAYVWGAFAVLCRYRPRLVRLTGDFGTIEKPVFLASTANTPCYGGAIRIAPDADPADGALDLCVIDGVSRTRAAMLVPVVLLSRHRTRPEVRFYRTRRFRLESAEPMQLWADGEHIATTPAEFSVVPGAISVLLPKTGRAIGDAAPVRS